MDAQVLASLRANGADLSKPHVIDHVFVFRTQQEAGMAAEALSKFGLKTQMQEHLEGLPWSLTASHTVVPTEAAIADVVARMEGFARTVGAEYDGWGTMPVR